MENEKKEHECHCCCCEKEEMGQWRELSWRKKGQLVSYLRKGTNILSRLFYWKIPFVSFVSITENVVEAHAIYLDKKIVKNSRGRKEYFLLCDMGTQTEWLKCNKETWYDMEADDLNEEFVFYKHIGQDGDLVVIVESP